MKNNGVKDDELLVTEEAIRDIVRYYTREAGVRSLERELSKICRKVVKGLQLKKMTPKVQVDGETPKDGPSAGAAMTLAFVSALTGIPVRAGVAKTGEITLRGEVTAIGGLKEKLLAAHRGGV